MDIFTLLTGNGKRSCLVWSTWYGNWGWEW